ncbi:aryl-sulfate sulfotransferase [Geobacter sulfurreducens]|jgi:arylsulfate sulfotransferase|uniref:aryl-sulfate sulfotransferase n=1 Tax=Geobacter sulfurreducens TaxID=35554 RepID=UPI0001D8F299|nr:aryl-sulfate sulfotransferase [Geobacter sulfurreducens]ADI85872.1 arylsulfotransferase [Geobacter sulfurreducens KN400]UTG92432.1 aryl-sulfate sulfotransferase [Geobacter sulfurreducens]
MVKNILRGVVSSAALGAVLLTGISAVYVPEGHAAVFERKKETQGELGKVIVNPYKVAPLTAIIERDGKDPKNITVTVLGKPGGGIDISYPVSEGALLNHDGIPVFGLYDDYVNQVKVEYTLDGKRISTIYRIRTNPFTARITEGRYEVKPKVEKATAVKGFEGRLYMLTLMGNADNKEWAWVRPDHKVHGAGEWLEPAEMYLVDTKGEIRWFLDSEQFYDKYGRDIDSQGRLMSMHQMPNGDLLFGMAQKYFRYSIMGEPSFARKLPRGYIDLSHEVLPMPNGHMLLRVAKTNYNIPGTKEVANTVRDHIIEVDEGGRVVEEWDMVEIMGKDQYRKDLIVGLDARAVCLNVDMNAEKIEVTENIPYGDNTSTGAGRNWAHINSISYDRTDDSIILSLRHQGTVKVGRDKQVKWILAPNVGWSKEMSAKVLTPVDSKGKKLDCTGATCNDTEFDWSYTQHTSWLSERGENNAQYTTISVFDNGDGRGLEQPAVSQDKHSRAVEYKIDEKNLTVQQTWQFGKERGWDWYSAVTSNVKYDPEKGTYWMLSGNVHLLTKERTKGIINEVDPKTGEVKVEIVLSNDKKPAVYYRSHLVKANQLFAY